MTKASLAKAADGLYRRRWPIWAVACLAHTLGLFHRASLSPMADRIMAEFGISATVLGSLGGAYFYIYAAMQLPSGALADTLGPRKTITIGLVLTAVGALVMSQAPSFPVVYAGRVVVSFGTAVVWLNVIKLLMVWFRSGELATMTGLSSSIANSGQILAATPLAVLITSFGWRLSILSVALVTFGLVAVSWFVIRDSPAKVGLPPISGYDAEAAFKTRDAPGLKLVLANKGLWPLFLTHFGLYGAYSTFFHNWAGIYLMQTYNVTRDMAANLPLAAAVGQVIGAPLFGVLSDRVWHRRRLVGVALGGVSLACFLVFSMWNGGKPPFDALYPLCFFIGLSMASVTLIFASVKDIAPASVGGTAAGLVNMGGFVSASFAQPVFGYLLDRGWRGDIIAGVRLYPVAAFQQGLWLCLVLVAIGFAGTLLSRETSPPKPLGDHRGGTGLKRVGAHHE